METCSRKWEAGFLTEPMGPVVKHGDDIYCSGEVGMKESNVGLRREKYATRGANADRGKRRKVCAVFWG